VLRQSAEPRAGILEVLPGVLQGSSQLIISAMHFHTAVTGTPADEYFRPAY
jgi:hypothetical protein